MSTHTPETARWLEQLRGNPVSWLLEESAPAVRHLALIDLHDGRLSDPDVVFRASAEATEGDPIAAILSVHEPEAFWVKPGAGYSPKYRAPVWQLGFGADPRLQPAVEWLLSKQGAEGRWRNQNAYNGKTRTGLEEQGKPGKWVTP